MLASPNLESSQFNALRGSWARSLDAQPQAFVPLNTDSNVLNTVQNAWPPSNFQNKVFDSINPDNNQLVTVEESYKPAVDPQTEAFRSPNRDLISNRFNALNGPWSPSIDAQFEAFTASDPQSNAFNGFSPYALPGSWIPSVNPQSVKSAPLNPEANSFLSRSTYTQHTLPAPIGGPILSNFHDSHTPMGLVAVTEHGVPHMQDRGLWRATTASTTAVYDGDQAPHPPRQMDGTAESILTFKKGSFFKCSQCPRAFRKYPDLQSHIKTIHERRIDCDVCGESFGSLSRLVKHQATHEGGHLKCAHCPKRFKRLDQFETHKLSHLGLKLFRCDSCGYEYKDLIRLGVSFLHRHSERSNLMRSIETSA